MNYDNKKRNITFAGVTWNKQAADSNEWRRLGGRPLSCSGLIQAAAAAADDDDGERNFTNTYF